MRIARITVVGLLLVAACGGEEPPASLKLLAHESFAAAVTDETFADFTTATGVEVEVISSADAGSMVNQAILTKDNPIADLMFGVDDTFLSRALDEGIFQPHESGLSASVDPSLYRGGDGIVTPIDFGDVCINYDKAWFANAGIPIPTSLSDLRDQAYAGLLAVEHPATSSPGLAFMLATIAELGEDGWLDLWSDLAAGGVTVAADWDTAYYGDFTRYGGDSPMVVSYASSPPAEVVFAEDPIEEAPTGVVDVGCYRQVEYAGILDGTRYPEAAGQLIDFMLSTPFQETIPLTWFVYPANRDAVLPEVFVDNTTLPAAPAEVDPSSIAANRERWIDEWVAVMEG